MKFRLLWIGSNADSEFRTAIERYVTRIRHFYPIEVIELPAEKGRQKNNDAAIMHADSARLIKALPSRGTAIALDPRGESMDSLRFSKWIERITLNEPDGATFVLGGDCGFDDSVREHADRLLSLSAMTLPHQIARLMLVEQLYRACTLIRNIPYHK